MDKAYLREVLKMSKSRSPILLMCGAVIDFREMYRGKVITLRTLEDVRECVNYYHGMSQVSAPLVIEDLAFLPDSGIQALLKFVEETPLTVILLTTTDCIDAVFKSRMRAVVKYQDKKTVSDFMSVVSALDKIKSELEENTSDNDRMIRVNRYSPLIHYYESTIKVRDRERILSILGV